MLSDEAIEDLCLLRTRAELPGESERLNVFIVQNPSPSVCALHGSNHGETQWKNPVLNRPESFGPHFPIAHAGPRKTVR